jgi:hypothetical protein
MFHHGATESTALYFFIQPGDTILWLWERLPAAITKEALERLFFVAVSHPHDRLLIS